MVLVHMKRKGVNLKVLLTTQFLENLVVVGNGFVRHVAKIRYR